MRFANTDRRRRSEGGFGTLQGRRLQELRLKGMTRLEPAKQFLREHFVIEFNRRFQVPALQLGNVFFPCRTKDLEVVLSVCRDITVVLGGTVFQIEATRWRGILVGCPVTVCEHLGQSWSVRYWPHAVGRYNAQGWPSWREHDPVAGEGSGKAAGWKTKSRFSTPLGNPAKGAEFPLSYSLGGGPSVLNRTYRVLGKADNLDFLTTGSPRQ